ncbi:MAG: hypothetical protein E5X48_18365 [Mesorhizobium sp.]|uniref:hypothetical protein n=1 Tax=Mesorhizobium sp. TaxID=1871066 RepID=UPI001221A424|nr:hypothetical protein [Mesorhizobium sp.]TIQ34598.1 MAG: hypothetical protein E5X48_18365 [Mesorhizobium sp.]
MRVTGNINVENTSERRLDRETPLETAARLRAEFGIKLSEQAREPVPRSVYDELSGEDGCLSTVLTDLGTGP